MLIRGTAFEARCLHGIAARRSCPTSNHNLHVAARAHKHPDEHVDGEVIDITFPKVRYTRRRNAKATRSSTSRHPGCVDDVRELHHQFCFGLQYDDL